MAILQPRGYQKEMLEESLRRNIIVALPTGGGKTLIAILRIHIELEKSYPAKRVWFLCPTIALADQQYEAIRKSLPSIYEVLLLCGEDNVDHWSSQRVWDRVLSGISVVVCTYQVLTDALASAFVRLADISLLVFDEAHCCTKRHTANCIMQEHYHPAKRKQEDIPLILALTASPISSKPNSLKVIEANLDAISRTPQSNQEELLEHVYTPQIIKLEYMPTLLDLSCNLLGQLEKARIYMQVNIHKDPYVVYLKSQRSDDYNPKLEQRLKKAINGGKTWCQEQIRRLQTVSNAIAVDLGYYCLSKYLISCNERLAKRAGAFVDKSDEQRELEINVVVEAFTIFRLAETLPEIDDERNHSPKANLLIESISKEMQNGAIGIIFVKTRATVRLLSDLLSQHPFTRDCVKIGTYVGASSHQNRPSHITELIDASDQQSTIDDLRTGTKNLIIATNVLEEGIDIPACNLVICYDPPSDVKSFIQRRGRARSPDSRLIVMFSKNERKFLEEWLELEEKMIEKYTDPLRELEELKRLQSEEDGYQEYVVASTGAKLLLSNAVDRLYKFCVNISSTESADTEPLFDFKKYEDCSRVFPKYTCVVNLSNDLDESLRCHPSASAWASETSAKKDAAFQAVVALHKAGLINDNLIPLRAFDEGKAEAFKIEGRPMIVEVEALFDIWRHVAQTWKGKAESEIYTCALEFTIQKSVLGEEEERVILLASSIPFPALSPLVLYIDRWTKMQVSFILDEKPVENFDVQLAEHITQLILQAGLRSRVHPSRRCFPVLSMPYKTIDEARIWNESMKGNVHGTAFASSFDNENFEVLRDVGLVRDMSNNGTAHFFLGIELAPLETLLGCQDIELISKPATKRVFRVRKLPKRRDFMHTIGVETQSAEMASQLLECENCVVDLLPAAWAYFSLALPSIYHYLSIHWIAERMRVTFFSEVFAAKDLHLVLSAISTGRAREKTNYQRLEFLGDCLLKSYTTISLLVAKPYWVEGYLSKAKDQLVSNRNLAAIAQGLGLGKFILLKPFTGAKWTPYYVDELLRSDRSAPDSRREISTKVLADVVEALIGASWLAGGEGSLLKCLQIFFPLVIWRPSSDSLMELKSRARTCSSPEPYTSQLYELLGYRFKTPSLVLEALTPPGRSSPGGLPSYQRMELLGDAILDLAVTFHIWAHPQELSERYMHRIRAAMVNGSFLAFCVLSRQIEVLTTKPSRSSRRLETCQSDKTIEEVEGTRLETHVARKSLLSFYRASLSYEFSTNLALMRQRFERHEAQITERLFHGGSYPWADLEAIAPKKVTSDLLESTLAAITIDHGQLMLGPGDEENSPSLHFLHNMGILSCLERVLSTDDQNALPYDPFKIWHPCEELNFLADREKVEYVQWSEGSSLSGPEGQHDDGVSAPEDPPGSSSSTAASNVKDPSDSTHFARVIIGKRLISEESGGTFIEARTRAAEVAVKILRLKPFSRCEKRGAGEMLDDDDDDDGGGGDDNHDDDVDDDHDDDVDDNHDDDVDDNHDDESSMPSVGGSFMERLVINTSNDDRSA